MSTATTNGRRRSHAVCTSTPQETITAVAEVLSQAQAGKPVERPFWQTEPCPAWCVEQHADDEDYEDRNHWAQSIEHLDLSLIRLGWVAPIPVDKTANGKEYPGWHYPQQLEVGARQHYRETEPIITLSVPSEAAHDVRLTVAEARQLIASLTHFVDTVAPQQPGGAV